MDLRTVGRYPCDMVSDDDMPVCSETAPKVASPLFYSRGHDDHRIKLVSLFPAIIVHFSDGP